MSTNSFLHDPDAVLDYTVDLSDWLTDGEEITGRTVTVPAGLVKDSDAISAGNTAVTAWLSGGTAGTRYEVIFHFVTDAGREDDRTITITCRQR